MIETGLHDDFLETVIANAVIKAIVVRGGGKPLDGRDAAL